MPTRRKIRSLPSTNNQVNNILFLHVLIYYGSKILSFDSVCHNDYIQMNEDEYGNNLLIDGIPRPTFGKETKYELNGAHVADAITNKDQDQSSNVRNKTRICLTISYFSFLYVKIISSSTIMNRIKQIQNSLEQATTMLESMEKIHNLVVIKVIDTTIQKDCYAFILVR